eukprot:scaffold7306_cov124-Isochrysis_galbana.AAC.1
MAPREDGVVSPTTPPPRHKGAGKGTTSSLLTKWNITWGPSHTPFGGTRWLDVDSYSRCVWGRRRPTAQSYSHSGSPSGSGDADG